MLAASRSWINLKLQYFGHLMLRVDSLEKTDAGRDWEQEEKGTTEDDSIAQWGGREGCCKQITLACARSASATLGLPPLTARVPRGWGHRPNAPDSPVRS